MWVSRVQSKNYGSLMLDVLDVGFQKAQEVSWFLRLNMLDVGFKGHRKFSGS